MCVSDHCAGVCVFVEVLPRTGLDNELRGRGLCINQSYKHGGGGGGGETTFPPLVLERLLIYV